jgi:hypothetical protein
MRATNNNIGRMSKIIRYITAISLAALSFCSCQEEYITYNDAEYIMFADTLASYPVQKDVEFFTVPVVSTTVCDYDRTFGVEVIDKESNAIESLHYRLESNTLTIKAGETRADVKVYGIYDNIEASDQLGFTLQLVMPDQLEMGMYGKRTKVMLVKSCPFDVNNFTGWCMFTSMFLYNYSVDGRYQRLIYTEKHPTEENTIICRNWLRDGYDVTMTFDPSDPLNPLVKMDSDQVASDEGSFFGITHGDDKILVESSPYYNSYFYSCGSYLYLYTHIYVENLGTPVGTVGHFYNIMEWISDEEADRLKREEGM